MKLQPGLTHVRERAGLARIQAPSAYPVRPPAARIYRPAPSVLQSAPALHRPWVLEFEPGRAKWVEPLMGWTATVDPFATIRLRFPDQQSAVAFARRQGLAFRMLPQHPRKRKRKNYTQELMAQELMTRGNEARGNETPAIKGEKGTRHAAA